MDTPQKHVMIDIETLGKGPNAMLISIGAVRFTATAILDRFLLYIDPGDSDVVFNRVLDVDTVMWWFSDDRTTAREEFLTADKVDFVTALEGFSMWFGGESLPTWGNGATFDNVIMRSAYDAAGIPCPWNYKDDRCYRTMKNLTPIEFEPVGTYHNPADDAESQALHLQKLLKELDIVI